MGTHTKNRVYDFKTVPFGLYAEFVLVLLQKFCTITKTDGIYHLTASDAHLCIEAFEADLALILKNHGFLLGEKRLRHFLACVLMYFTKVGLLKCEYGVNGEGKIRKGYGINQYNFDFLFGLTGLNRHENLDKNTFILKDNPVQYTQEVKSNLGKNGFYLKWCFISCLKSKLIKRIKLSDKLQLNGTSHTLFNTVFNFSYFAHTPLINYDCFDLAITKALRFLFMHSQLDIIRDRGYANSVSVYSVKNELANFKYSLGKTYMPVAGFNPKTDYWYDSPAFKLDSTKSLFEIVYEFFKVPVSKIKENSNFFEYNYGFKFINTSGIFNSEYYNELLKYAANKLEYRSLAPNEINVITSDYRIPDYIDNHQEYGKLKYYVKNKFLGYTSNKNEEREDKKKAIVDSVSAVLQTHLNSVAMHIIDVTDSPDKKSVEINKPPQKIVRSSSSKIIKNKVGAKKDADKVDLTSLNTWFCDVFYSVVEKRLHRKNLYFYLYLISNENNNYVKKYASDFLSALSLPDFHPNFMDFYYKTNCLADCDDLFYNLHFNLNDSNDPVYALTDNLELNHLKIHSILVNLALCLNLLKEEIYRTDFSLTQLHGHLVKYIFNDYFVGDSNINRLKEIPINAIVKFNFSLTDELVQFDFDVSNSFHISLLKPLFLNHINKSYRDYFTSFDICCRMVGDSMLTSSGINCFLANSPSEDEKLLMDLFNSVIDKQKIVHSNLMKLKSFVNYLINSNNAK